MNKLIALYINEIIKVSRKISVIVILILMIVGIIGIGGVMKIQQIASDRYSFEDPERDRWMEEENAREIEFMKAEIRNLETRIETAEDESDKEFYRREKAMLESRLEIYEMAADLGISFYEQGYKREILNELIHITEILNTIQEAIDQGAEDETILKEYERLTELRRKYILVIQENRFSDYIDFKIEDIRQNQSITEEKRKIQIDTYELWLRVDPDGERSSGTNSSGIVNTLDQIERMRISLLHNVEHSYSWSGPSARPLTPQARETLENDIAVLTYRLENDLISGYGYMSSDYIYEFAMTGMTGFAGFLVIIMMLILAGGAVSQEISSGSIKSLIISPTKRYKIFFAKVAALLSVGIVSTLLIYLIAVPSHMLYFGPGTAMPYVYAVNGVAGELNFYLYSFASGLIDFIDVIVYMVFALMLSVVTRNTAVAVGVSVAIYFGGNLVTQFISFFASGEWIKFIPFNNMSLASRVFPETESALYIGFYGMTSKLPSVTFSLIYLSVFIICTGYIALDSFNRRDIK